MIKPSADTLWRAGLSGGRQGPAARRRRQHAIMSRAAARAPLVVTGTSLTHTEKDDDLAAWASPKMVEGVRDEQSNPWSSLPPPPTQVHSGSHPPQAPNTNRGKVPSATRKWSTSRPSLVPSRQGITHSPDKGLVPRPADSAASTGIARSNSHRAEASQPPADRDRRKNALAKVNEKIAGTGRVATAASRTSPKQTKGSRMSALPAPPVRWSVTGKVKAKAAQHTKALKGTRSSARDSSKPREGREDAGKTARTEKGNGSATSAEEPAAAHNVLDGEGEVRAILERLRQGANEDTLPQKSAAGAGSGTAEAELSRLEALAPAVIVEGAMPHHGETHEAMPPPTTPSRATSPQERLARSDDAYGDALGPTAGAHAAPAGAPGTTERCEAAWADAVAEMEARQHHEVQRMVQELDASMEAAEAERERMRRAEQLRQEISRHADANQQRLLDTYRENSEPLVTFMRDLREKIACMGSMYEAAHAKYMELQRTYVEQAARLRDESTRQTQALCTAPCGGSERTESVSLCASDEPRDGAS